MHLQLSTSFSPSYGVVGHERLIKGFKVVCYMDHKNNLFSEAQLDNRRRSKKMSNWALELQQFNIVRVWIRGEANILGDAPSRAPWETQLARNLPIPDLPLRQIIQTMYRSPEALEKMVQEKKKMQNLDEWQAIEKTEHPDAFAYPDFVETPEFSPSSNQKGEGQKRSATSNFSILLRGTGALRRSTPLSAARRR